MRMSRSESPKTRGPQGRPCPVIQLSEGFRSQLRCPRRGRDAAAGGVLQLSYLSCDQPDQPPVDDDTISLGPEALRLPGDPSGTMNCLWQVRNGFNSSSAHMSRQRLPGAKRAFLRIYLEISSYYIFSRPIHLLNQKRGESDYSLRN